MKQVLLLTILALAFCFQVFGQENECPTIKIIPPSKPTSVEDSMLFSVSLTGKFDNSKFEYKWTVSNSTISDGQGTTAISVATTKEMDGQTVTATVEIKGLPEGCENRFSESDHVAPLVVCRCNIAEYEKVSWLKEREHLEGLIAELSNDTEAKVLFLFSFKKDAEMDLILSRQKKILRYLEKRKIPSSRILVKIEKIGHYLTKIIIVPEGADLP